MAMMKKRYQKKREERLNRIVNDGLHFIVECCDSYYLS